MTTKANVFKGSDQIVRVPFVNTDGSAFNLTGYTAVVFDAVSTLSDLLSVSIPSPTSGEVVVVLDQTSTQPPVGEYAFRIQATDGAGNSISSPRLAINVI